MKRFIVFEGLDGAGKSTQIELLTGYLDQLEIRHHFIHFPQTDAMEHSPVFGQMVANFLKGDYGDINQVNPYLVALLFAGDRKNAAERINRWLDCGDFVVLDRYVYSNMAFQGAKFEDPGKKRALFQWIRQLEYGYHGIPEPELSLFLRMPLYHVKKKLTDARMGADRVYLDGKVDIHENSLDFQAKVEQEYLSLVKNNNDFQLIDCFESNGTTLSPRDIHEKVITQLRQLGMLE